MDTYLLFILIFVWAIIMNYRITKLEKLVIKYLKERQ